MKLGKTAIILMMVSRCLAAQDIRIIGTMSKTLTEPVIQTSGGLNTRMSQPAKIQEIKLLKMALSPRAQRILADNANKALKHTNQFSVTAAAINEPFPSNVQLRMNQVPVLNQGRHGSCATFAVTAAIDAVLSKGAYLSELCPLQVGNYLANNGYAPGGWNGSFGRQVLSQLDSFGIVNREQEALHGCGGLVQYPTNEADPTSSMSLEEYHQLSEPLDQNNVTWWPILDVFHAITTRLDTNTTLTDVKASLNEGDRVMFGILLLDFDLGTMGAVGTKNGTNDTWVLTPEIARDVVLHPDFGGHAMIITGYDDNAIATDDKGRAYKGLLTLRNSWGEHVGDHGDFYMSYDYFKLLVLEAQHIHDMSHDADDSEPGDEIRLVHKP